MREGIIKHSRDYALASFPELEGYLLEQRPLLEAQLIDPADEITYNCADLDDAIDGGLIDTDTARGEVPLFDRLMREAETSYPAASERQVFNEALRRTLDRLVTGLIEGTRAAALEADIPERGTSSRLPREACRPEPRSGPGVETAQAIAVARGLSLPGAQPGPPTDRPESNRPVPVLHQPSRAIARFLPEPKPARTKPSVEPLHRVVCDYIAGMTDKYLLHQHENLLSA